MTHCLHRLKITALAFALSLCPLWAGGDGWMSHFAEAKARAAEQGKDLLLNFTGSDWCGWCIKLEKEVFSQDGFERNVARDFVLVVLDNPRKRKLPEAVEKQNQSLRDLYAVTGCPVVLLCDAQGRPYAKTGYRQGGVDDYLKHLTGLRRQKSERDAGLAAAVGLDGPAKARALEKALSVVPCQCLALYKNELAAIALADPDDISGFTAKVKVGATANALRVLIQPLFIKRDFEAALVRVDTYIREKKPAGEALQTAMLYKLQALYMERKFDEAMQLAEEVIAINDTNRPARFSSMIKKRIERLRSKKSE